MKKRVWIITLGVCAACAFLLLWGYRSITAYMQDRYAPNTWVNGIYCTGRTVEDVNQELLSNVQAPVVEVTGASGESFLLPMEQMDSTSDFTQALQAYQLHQRKNGWLSALGKENEIVPGEPAFSYSAEKVEEWWKQLPIVQAEKEEPIFQLTLDEDGYHLMSTLDGHLDTEKGLTELSEAIAEGSTTLSLTESGCYFDYPLTDAQKKLVSDYEELCELEKCGLTYDMGAEKIAFDEGLMSTFIEKDETGMPIRQEDGRFGYDLSKVEEFITDLCEQYHTYGVDRQFQSSRGETVTVPAGTFGTEIDTDAERRFILELFGDDQKRLALTVHTPVYLHETDFKGLNDIGGTYIEVDMKEQKIYFYKDYELMVSSGIVTGNLRTRHGTPAGAYYIYGKYKNRVLRGPGYASFVRRWMPVVKAIGLHDANWRSEFGGDIYQTNGSHGCVNMPDETTDIIFEYAEIGTPVLIYE